MSENTLRLDSGQNGNWNARAAPVAILNDASTLHERLAYLWGLVDQLAGIVNIMTQHNNQDVSCAANSLYWHIQPMASLLGRMADDTRPGMGEGNTPTQSGNPVEACNVR
jgi:hypothetical protein